MRRKRFAFLLALCLLIGWSQAALAGSLMENLFGLLFPEKFEYSGPEGMPGVGASAADDLSGVTYFCYSYDGTIGGVTYFRYSYDGTIGGDSFSYTASREEGTFTVWRMGDPMEECSIAADDTLFDALNRLYLDCRLAEWDGFDMYDPYVLDGSGFSLSIGFADGETMNASGSNCVPDGYGAFCERMDELLEPLARQAREMEKERLIKAGINGKLDFLMADFVQHGASGSDRYEIFVQKIEDSANVELCVTSESGEFFPIGEHSLEFERNADELFDAIQALAEQYSVLEWIGFDESVEDYNNAEWFQLELQFDDGLHISAMGTEHPERYDEFRHDLLELFAEKSKPEWSKEGNR